MASSSSFGSSSSSGGSYIPDYPQSPILMNIAQYASSLAPQMLQWGQGVYNKNQSLADSIVREGQLYASPGRIKQDMGTAEAGVSQAGDAAMQAHKRDLAGFGIDPSSGRYAALDSAERTRTAAAAAGAGNQQRMATEATGRAIRSEGANLSLANANSGANLMRIPNDYLRTGMELKYPPLGNQTHSQSNQSGSSSSPDHEQGGQRGGGGGGSPGGGGGGTPGQYGSGGGGADQGSGGGSRGGGGGGGGGAPSGDVPGGGRSKKGGYGGMEGSDPVPYTGQDDTSGQIPSQDYWGSSGEGSSAFGNSDDPNQSVGQFNGDWGQSPDTNNGGYGDNSASWDQGDAGGGYNESDFSGGGNDDWGSFAGGGGVDPSMSPSGGDDVDDVPAQVGQSGGRAQLNVDEFVIPRDVAMWKGQEFFQKLITQSRQNRMAAPAHPTMGQGGN